MQANEEKKKGSQKPHRHSHVNYNAMKNEYNRNKILFIISQPI